MLFAPAFSASGRGALASGVRLTASALRLKPSWPAASAITRRHDGYLPDGLEKATVRVTYGVGRKLESDGRKALICVTPISRSMTIELLKTI